MAELDVWHLGYTLPRPSTDPVSGRLSALSLTCILNASTAAQDAVHRSGGCGLAAVQAVAWQVMAREEPGRGQSQGQTEAAAKAEAEAKANPDDFPQLAPMTLDTNLCVTRQPAVARDLSIATEILQMSSIVLTGTAFISARFRTDAGMCNCKTAVSPIVSGQEGSLFDGQSSQDGCGPGTGENGLPVGLTGVCMGKAGEGQSEIQFQEGIQAWFQNKVDLCILMATELCCLLARHECLQYC